MEITVKRRKVKMQKFMLRNARELLELISDTSLKRYDLSQEWTNFIEVIYKLV